MRPSCTCLPWRKLRRDTRTLRRAGQQDYHVVELSYEKMWRQKTDYIHNNPVRAGVVEHAEDYLYSSARFYYNKKCLIDLAPK